MRLTIKDHIRESRLFNERAAFALVAVLLLLMVGIARLVYLQIISHEHFSTLSDVNRISLVPVPPTRGLIYDRNGVVLAQNLPAFSLVLIPEQISDMDATISELRKLVTISDEDVRRFHRQVKQKRAFNSIALRFNLNDEEIARFAVRRHLFPGVEIEARAIRNYPLGTLASHAIGYVGRINEEELRDIDASNYSGTDFIGKTGIERFYENLLHGQVGFKQIETNAYGRTLRELQQSAPTPGKNLYLSLDIGVQRVAEAEFAGRRGAAVAIDPRSGEVIAFVSMPGFDPNLFVTGIDVGTYSELQTSLDRPLFNRALRGQYPPGSTLKPFIGLAGLESNKITLDAATFCPGWYRLPGDPHKYRDWKERGHGFTTMDKAIVESCDVYFYDLASTLGIDLMHDFLAQFSFGQPTGIDLRDESSGLLPSRQWKRARRGQPWYPGETLITGIGQGYTLTTPLQLAYATAVLATHGAHTPPHLLRAVGTGGTPQTERLPAPMTNVPVKSRGNWDAIITAMRHVVSSERGTAQAIGRKAPFPIAGKTGTAQVFGIKQDEKYVEKDVAERLRDHSLFIAFAPAEDPRIALAVMVENAGHGSTAAAPLARKMIDQYLGNPPP
ncbi:MAG: penicillin-binding protein 2 [Gammaproteobacteria bacterium]|nr:penicillin-binding protein 2 [Gammaproteobacteria bacterium]